MSKMLLNAPDKITAKEQELVGEASRQPESVTEFLDASFTMRQRQEVLSFVKMNKFLLPLLREAHQKVIEHIPDASISLAVFRDPEGQVAPYLVGVIESQIPLMQRFDLQEQIRQNWWLGVFDAANDKFHLEL